MTEFLGISHLDLTVRDAETSADWYIAALGLDRLKRADFEDRIMIVLGHKASGLIIGLNQHFSPDADQFSERIPGLDHVGFTVSTRDQLVEWEKHFTELGIEHSPITDAPSGSGTALVFRDPDNIQLEMWWPKK